MKPKKRRCSKGHEWESTYFGGQDSVIVFGGPPICLHCIAEFLAANMGIAEDVPESDEPIIQEKGKS